MSRTRYSRTGLAALTCAALACLFAYPALASPDNFLHLTGDALPSLFLEPLALAGLVASMPVKSNGKTIKAGQPLDGCSKADLAELKAMGILRNADIVIDDDDSGGEFDLADTLQTLISEGNDIAGMNMREINKLLGANSKGVKKADIDAALDAIKADEGDTVNAILAVIETMGADVTDPETGKVDPAKVAVAFYEAEDEPDMQAVGAAINAFEAKQA